MSAFVLLPVDLYNDISLLKNSKVFLVEEEHYFNRSAKQHGSMRLNVLKPVYHRATMMCYFDYLKSKKIDCEYVELKKDWVKTVRKYVEDTECELKFYDPVDRLIEKKISSNFKEYEVINTHRFILTTEEMESYEGALRQTSFYAWIRNLKQILMVQDKNKQGNHFKPVGGKLTYDKENRKKPYQGIEDDVDDGVDARHDYTNNVYVTEAFTYIKKTLKESDVRVFGGNSLKKTDSLSDTEIVLKFPIDRAGSLARLRHFIKNNLFRFGDYQDVMLDDENNSFVFHSALSPMINVGLLTPEEVVKAVTDHYDSLPSKDKLKRLNDVEGFIRQILGWREFTRYMYEHHSDKYLDKNYFSAKKQIGDEWYDGTTNYLPLDQCIRKAFKFGYLHHIERLMIVANYMTLAGVAPKEMYRWFTEFSLDSYDWVMEYNVYCMGSYADGGQFTSKPYISTSKYILSMSNYNKDGTAKNDNDTESSTEQTDVEDTWTTRWDKLFWGFLDKHKTKIKKIGRLSMLLKYASKLK
ncbi:cryptochrome/photolyase family protein [Yasminevirus sp. GU-2018]|uniref:Cryptochrome/photolyase family protein n=1 Tax=Yasminevirus sp. GU-2018 TaxID=2420051 RepID=A0A5K0U7Q0_9VIRU|nr:cryptochrome/photolyase family protein [Yasminevirus sp. GU-2018]